MEEKEAIIEQLIEAQNALFSARTIKEAKFWQEKIKYLKKLLNSFE